MGNFSNHPYWLFHIRQMGRWSAQLCITAISPLIATVLSSAPVAANTSCPAALTQMQNHRVVAGETLTSVATAYRLSPITLNRFNPGLSEQLSPGTELLIPPFNGMAVAVATGESWQSLAERYGTRADLLFEINGCVTDVPNRIFVPGGLTPVTSRASTDQLAGYPLASSADIALSYGWQPHPTRDELVFNSGIAFAITTPTDVLSVEGGTVAFAGSREGYGQMVVINHERGLQTRYINLSDISVTVGQTVTASTKMGRVGGETPTFLYFEVRSNSASGWVAEDPGRYLPSLDLR
ncbi:MAG: M23 family metallopeptidase [Phormidesmis sp. RL_2_1]|nr:M23 family metallopeptidase [Phormidesmis sp. RL_2_1]